MDPFVNEGYREINHIHLPHEFPLQYKDNEIIKEARRLVAKTPAYKESLKSLMPKNEKLKIGEQDPAPTNLLYWDHIKLLS